MRWLKRFVLSVVLLLVLVISACNIWIVKSTEDKVYSDVALLPEHRMGLVLGTSHRLEGGAPNPFFQNRIDMAATLYAMGKVDHFILSGDNSSRYYNEPVEMKKALIKKGVPASAITLDYAGLRTLDSVVRSKKIFGQNEITIITQPFHSYRALFISRYYDMDAVAMVADDAEPDQTLKLRLREYLARTKAVLDLYVFKTDPRFLGEKEEIIIAS
ncbi:MAG TPA: ElyC/SanA/YdcF family protein [Chryseosolibacter sp.]|nr:ElyC/SanA/YdcF family protein [Chryseosolibacter sp.]